MDDGTSPAPGGGWILLGHCWTRSRVSHHLDTPADRVVAHPALLRVGCPVALEEAYPAFQFDAAGIRWEMEPLLLILRRRVDDCAAADWMARPNGRLDGRSPLEWLTTHRSMERILDALPEPTRALPGDTSTERASVLSSWHEAQTTEAQAARKRQAAAARLRRKRAGAHPTPV